MNKTFCPVLDSEKRVDSPVLTPDKRIFILSVRSDFSLYAEKVKPVTILNQDIERSCFLSLEIEN